MITVSSPPEAPAATPTVEESDTPAEDALPLGHAQPWICRENIAPRIWSEADRTVLWMESNGSEGCYGGWELLFPVAAQPGDALLLQLAAQATGLERGTDELIVEAFWYDDSGAEVNWDPVLLDRATMDDDGRLFVYYAKALRYPAGATRLGVRCGLRWSPRGRVRWHGWRLQRPAPRPPRTLRLGVASGRPRKWESTAASIAHYVEQCRRAGAAGVDLVCLPETILSAGSPDRSPAAVHAHAVPVPGPWLEPFREVARAYRMGICFSVLERAGAYEELVYNTALLLGRDGRANRHLPQGTSGPRGSASRCGGRATIFRFLQFDGVTVGMGICMDSSAAETCRILAQRGAEIMLMPIMGDFRATRWVQRRQRVRYGALEAGAARPCLRQPPLCRRLPQRQLRERHHRTLGRDHRLQRRRPRPHLGRRRTGPVALASAGRRPSRRCCRPCAGPTSTAHWPTQTIPSARPAQRGRGG